MKTKTVPVRDITVGKRFRKDVGDVDGLADSIKAIGLMHPVVVTPKLRLVAGFRRLTACKKLGWKSIPVRLLDIDKIIDGEFMENVARKDFTLSEIAAIARELRPRVEAEAQERRRAGLRKRWASSDVESCPDRPAGKTRDIIARYVGLSGRSLDKIEAISTAARNDPARYGHLKAEMDRGGKAMRLNRLYLQLRHQQAANAARQQTPVETVGDVRLHHCDFRMLEKHVRPGTARLVLVDPPWGRDALGLWPDVATCADALLVDGGVAAVLTPLMYLPEVVAALGHRLQYRWTMALFRGDPCPLVVSEQIMNAWRPVLLYSKGECGPLRIRDALSYSRAAWKKEFHPWEQNPDEHRYLVEHLTQPGELVVDFFGGSFGSAVVCREAGRRYHGADTDEGCVSIGRKRVMDAGIPGL
jgi:ParB-like nuclease domain/DNA methylase